jgi:hypothetical protein
LLHIQYSQREEGQLSIPTARSLQEMVSWKHVEMAFNKSFQNIDHAFLDTIPTGSRYRIRTTLKNVILNGIIVYIKHFEHIDFIREKEADTQLYHLDVLTPAPAFVGPEKTETHIPGSKRKKKVNVFHAPVHIQLVDSEGEMEDIELAL